MSPVTEFALVAMKAGVNPEDPNTPEGQVWQETLTTLSGQDGCQRMYWGREVENRTNMRLFIDWESHESHKNFMKSREYGPFVKNLGSLIDSPPQLYHIALQPHPPSQALSDSIAPATEVLTMYFPTSISQADQDAHSSNMAKLGEALKQTEGFRGASMGWSVEDSVPYAQAEGGKAKVFNATVGWTSVQAHMAARETQVFKDALPHLSEIPNVGTEMYHINTTEVQGGGLGAEERGAIGGGAADAQEEVLNPQGGGVPKPKSMADGTTTKNKFGAEEREARRPT